MGISLSDPEPITVMSYRHLTPWDLTKLAAKLGLDEEGTRDCIRSSAVGLQTLGSLLEGGAVAFDEVDRAIDQLKIDCRFGQDPL